MTATATPADTEPGSPASPGAGKTIPAVFFERAKIYGARDYMHYFRDGEWHSLSWAETARRALRVAGGLTQAGLRPGDNVALLSPNRPEWLYCDLGIMAAGGITVPVYPTLTPRVAALIASDSKTHFAIVSNAAMAAKLQGGSHLSVAFEMDAEIAAWAAGEPAPEALREVDARLHAMGEDDVATIIYTSGTSGDPKGVILTHRHFLEAARSCLEVFTIGPDDVILSYLPYSHVMERVDGIFVPTSAGATVWLARGLDTLVDDIQVARPTIMLGVPRVFEKVYEAVYDQVRAQSVFKRAIFRWAVAVGTEHARGGWLPGIRVRMGAAESLVLGQLRKRLTGGRLRFFISGGAPLNEKVEEFFWALGVKILQGWGLTEATSAVTSNTEQEHRYRTVGQPLPGTEIRIARDGEIEVRGPGVMAGYLNKATATAEIIVGGWLQTGDMGFVDKDGFLTITDRKKDLIKTSGGKYVAPLPIESQIENDRYVKAALVVGDRRPYVVALIVPDWQALAADIGPAGAPSTLVADPGARAHFASVIDKVNQGLSSFESVKYFALLARDFSEADDELTPSMKKKRSIIVGHFEDVIEAMYSAHRKHDVHN
ncbi:MAG TPA: long-chain fatty acid--CoA ligase [Candidatus Micrarchaeaceae archaeon]|nr:long-chain fatty acid--CoA ligase [Candidatus Micrarchaeaceae archaeon]